MPVSISSFESDAERYHAFDTRELILEGVPNAFRDRTISDTLRLITNPLLLAVKWDHRDTFDALLAEKRPDRTYGPAQLRTVLHWAIQDHDDEHVEQMIAERTPLGTHRLALSALGVAVEDRFDAIVPRLLEVGAQPAPTEYPGTLDIGILTEQSEVVALLLEHGLWITCDAGLNQIAMTNEMPLLILLFEYGLNMNPWCLSSFFTAIIWGNYEMVDFMLAKGIDSNFTVDVLPRAQETYTSSAIGLAIRVGYLDIFETLASKWCLSRNV